MMRDEMGLRDGLAEDFADLEREVRQRECSHDPDLLVDVSSHGDPRHVRLQFCNGCGGFLFYPPLI